MTATDAQVRLLMRERTNGKTQQQAAVKVNLHSRKTVQKYEQLGQLPSDLKEARRYRTRPDPFEKDWAEIETKLAAAPELEAKAIFEWLCEQDGIQYQEGQLRTLQRRVSNWRVLNGNPTLTLDQIHYPGEVLQSDGTCMNELEVTIQGEPFDHILFHSVLPYSNWEWGRVVQSESLLSIRLGLQSALLKLGYVPQAHQTDHTTAATHKLGAADRQQGPRERGYSVPSGLKGKRATVRIYEWHIEVWYANQRIETMPRMPGAHHYQINYRHVIDSLLRKPGGFRNYRYRDDLFPLDIFRQAWDVLNEHLPPRRADLTYLRILKQAALGMESDIAQALRLLLDQDQGQNLWDEKTITELTRVMTGPKGILVLALPLVNLTLYDQLFLLEADYVAA